jgi:chromosome segregation protein
MRLSKIKLAGFKSFVDPTTITFPSSLVGVVGPNGCGKSNVIDAVRWVMGESSASRLRGDSITDVIFNGSSARKPVGAASVELLFDNADTTLEGQYAKYAEIGIRREVSRDGRPAQLLDHRAGNDLEAHRGQARGDARFPGGGRGHLEVQRAA